MKLGVLRSIAHNIANSLADGNGLMIGVYNLDVFGEAAASAEQVIEVDFLRGEVVRGDATSALVCAVELYAKALAELCASHGASSSDFRQLTTVYSPHLGGGSYSVTVEDQRGRVVINRYVGHTGRRTASLDALGRIRRNPTVRV